MKKNIVYHRAGVDLRTTQAYELLKNDIMLMGKAMGLSNDQIQIGTINDLNDMTQENWYISVLDQIESNNFISRETNPEQFNISDSSGDITDKDVDVFLFNLSDTHKFLISCMPVTAPGVYNKKIMYYFRVRYDFIANETHHFCYGIDHGSGMEYGRIRWNVAITDFGATMSLLYSDSTPSNILPFFTSPTQKHFQMTGSGTAGSSETGVINILKSSSFGIYFSTLQDINDKTINYPAIYYVNSKEPEVDDSYGNNNYFAMRCLSPCLGNIIENVPSYFFYNSLYQARGTIPVLVNYTSKISDYYAPNIYVKETPHEKLFGVVQLGEKKFIAGSYLCLECGAEGDVN